MINLDNWTNNIDKYLFLLKDDFFQVPYFYNSPEKMVEGLEHLPISEHIIGKQFISINSEFYTSTILYRKIEEGFWILLTNMKIKENIVTIANFDKYNAKDYYFLNLSFFQHQFFIKDSHYSNLDNITWTFNKPNTEVPNYFYENTQGNIITFAIKKDWAKKKLTFTNIKHRKAVFNLLNNKKGFYRWTDIVPNSLMAAAELSEGLKNEENINCNISDIKKKSIKLINSFFENSFTDNRLIENISLKNSDYNNAAKAEKIILRHLHLPFVGIEFIAKEVNTSPTKLKTNFKTIYGFTMLQYHKEKNMLFAKQLIYNSKISIQDIANITGYGSASRFASSYKNRFGQLPSKVRLEF